MTLQEILQALRDAGVARARLSEQGALVEVEFAPTHADIDSATRDPYGIPDAYQQALGAFSGPPRGGEERA